MNIEFDKQGTKKFFDWLADKMMVLMFPKVLELFKVELSDEELLTKKELAERILKCTVDTAEKHYIFKKGFPYIEQGEGRKYPKKLVEKWIAENSKYN